MTERLSLPHFHFGCTRFPSHKSITRKYSQGHQLDQSQDSPNFSGITVPQCLISIGLKTIVSNTMYVYFGCLSIWGVDKSSPCYSILPGRGSPIITVKPAHHMYI